MSRTLRVVCAFLPLACAVESTPAREPSLAASAGGSRAGLGGSPAVPLPLASGGASPVTSGSGASSSLGGGPGEPMGGFGGVLGGASAGGSGPASVVNADGSLTPTRAFALFNGVDLSGWFADVPDKDADPTLPESFIVRAGLLVSRGQAIGHLLTEARYRDYRLEVEYRFAAGPGNCGVLVHASELRALYGAFPKSIEVQMFSGDAGDFWCIQENIEVPNMDERRPHSPGQAYGGSEADARRILNLTDNSEKPVGEWNTMVIEAAARTVTVWLNGDLVNAGFNSTADHGSIALQAEGAEVEFRRVELGPLRGAL